jgi:hypothetical protein
MCYRKNLARKEDFSKMTFIGFFPKKQPRYVIAVLIDEPKTVRFAGTAACPVFRQIGESLILLDGDDSLPACPHQAWVKQRGSSGGHAQTADGSPAD